VLGSQKHGCFTIFDRIFWFGKLSIFGNRYCTTLEIRPLYESTTTRKAGGLDFPALRGGERQKHVCALKWLLKNVPLFELFFYNPLCQPQRFYKKRNRGCQKNVVLYKRFFLQPLMPATTFL
jgi:hypothetical protein